MTDSLPQVLIDRATFARVRTELGANFVRILGYFREDGAKSVAEAEAATRAMSAAALVTPAHTLKGEARQFGADALADLAETIEHLARDCVEMHESPSEALPLVVELRPLFEATLAQLADAAAATPAPRRFAASAAPAAFGRRVGGGPLR